MLDGVIPLSGDELQILKSELNKAGDLTLDQISLIDDAIKDASNLTVEYLRKHNVVMIS